MKAINNSFNDFIHNLRVRKEDFYEYLYYYWLKRKFKNSQLLKLNYCKACGYCCRYTVCVPTPNELDIIADYLDLRPIDFILEKCGFAHYHKELENKTICIVYPRFLTKSMIHKAGELLDIFNFYDTKGCIFLTNDNKCFIYPVRPQEAKLQECWNITKDYFPIKTWDNDILSRKYEISIKKG